MGRALVMMVPSIAEQRPVSDRNKMIAQKRHDLRGVSSGSCAILISSFRGASGLSVVDRVRVRIQETPSNVIRIGQSVVKRG